MRTMSWTVTVVVSLATFPSRSATSRVTTNIPGFRNRYDGVGPVRVLIPPSEKDHVQDAIPWLSVADPAKFTTTPLKTTCGGPASTNGGIGSSPTVIRTVSFARFPAKSDTVRV